MAAIITLRRNPHIIYAHIPHLYDEKHTETVRYNTFFIIYVSNHIITSKLRIKIKRVKKSF